jgi:hypothetical protein
VRVFGFTCGAPPRTTCGASPRTCRSAPLSRAPAVAYIAEEKTDRYAAPSGTTTTGGGSPARGKRRERLAAAHGVCEVVKEEAASRLGSRRKTARIRMQMATTQRASRELRNQANHCRCHEPARGHYWDPVTLRCTNGSCTRMWGGQQVSPTDCEHPRNAPWERTSDASPTGSMRDAGPRERRHVQEEV